MSFKMSFKPWNCPGFPKTAESDRKYLYFLGAWVAGRRYLSEEIQVLFDKSANDVINLSINLIKKEIQIDNDHFTSFEVDKNLIDRIVFGIDDIDITLSHKNDIIDFEKSRMKKHPWIFAND